MIPCQGLCTSQHNWKYELMEMASAIHIYYNTHNNVVIPQSLYLLWHLSAQSFHEEKTLLVTRYNLAVGVCIVQVYIPDKRTRSSRAWHRYLHLDSGSWFEFAYRIFCFCASLFRNTTLTDWILLQATAASWPTLRIPRAKRPPPCSLREGDPNRSITHAQSSGKMAWPREWIQGSCIHLLASPTYPRWPRGWRARS